MNEAEARARMAGARVARLATGGGGGPLIVPICFALDGDTVYSVVDDKPKRTRSLRRLAEVRSDPLVAVLADHWSEDWSELWWVRADGRARVLEPESRQDAAERERAVTLLRDRYSQYATHALDGPVLAVVVTAWRWWSAFG
jgi:PPOX class probable F420-dependent enzyme